MVNNVIGVDNYVIAARPSLRNFMIADTRALRADVPVRTRSATATQRKQHPASHTHGPSAGFHGAGGIHRHIRARRLRRPMTGSARTVT